MKKKERIIKLLFNSKGDFILEKTQQITHTPIIPIATTTPIISAQKTDIKHLLQQRKSCPECHSDRINYDDLRDEISCLNCGLVLAAPPQYVAGQIKVDMPWHYTFDNEVEWKTRVGVFTAWVGERQPDYK